MTRPKHVAGIGAGALIAVILLLAALKQWQETASPSAQPEGGGASPPPAAVDSTDWPMLQGNPQLTGVSTGVLPGEPALVWTHDANVSIESSAAIVGQQVFVGIGSEATANSRKGVIALDLASGRERWSAATRASVSSSPCVAGGRVFLADHAGWLYAFGAEDGQEIWSVKLGEGDEIKASPIVFGQQVLIGSYDAHVYAVDRATGKERWAFETDERVHPTVATDGGRVFTASCTGVLSGLDLKSGDLVFSLELPGPILSALTLHRGDLFFGNHAGQVMRVAIAEGRVVWDTGKRYKQPINASPAVQGERLVIGGDGGRIWCLNVSDGKELWHHTTKDRVASSPAILGKRVFVGGDDGVLRGLSLATGKEVWRFKAGSSIRSSPAIARGRLVIAATDGAIYCFGSP